MTRSSWRAYTRRVPPVTNHAYPTRNDRFRRAGVVRTVIDVGGVCPEDWVAYTENGSQAYKLPAHVWQHSMGPDKGWEQI